MAGALEGVRVVDMTTVGMGPMATQLLGDLGADVVKVESAGGDVFRHVSPQRHHGMSHAYLNFNRNKRSVLLDAKGESGRETLFALIGLADVFVTNMRAPATRRLGLDADSLLAAYPRLIHCSCYGYGEGGPYAGRAAVDDTIQAACGLAWLQGDAGQSAPTYAKTVVADKSVALYVSTAITAALFSRERTGAGQAIEVPMFECMVSYLTAEHLAGRTYIPPEGPAGYSRLLNAFRRPFATRDGFISVVPYTDAQWQRFFALAGAPGLAQDARYSNQTARSQHFAELYAYIEQIMKQRDTAQWLDQLDGADIPFSPVNSIDDLISDPHLAATGFWQQVEHPTEGSLRQAGLPIRFSGTPASVRQPAPALGAHDPQHIIQGWRSAANEEQAA